MSQPTVSVILPVYNAESTLKKAVLSILNQNFTSFELIIINDGSTDDTLKVLEEFRDERIRLFNITRSGIARALNFGIKMSCGIYIARMDADDYAVNTRLEKQAHFLQRNEQIGLVSCKIAYKGDRDKNQGYSLYVDWINGLTEPSEIQKKRFQESPFAHPSVMFKKSLIRKYGRYSEENLPEDYELWLRWLDNDVLMAKLSDILYHWYDRPKRLSREHPNYEPDKFYKLKAQYLNKHLLDKYGRSALPKVWIWGTGKSVRKRVAPLMQLGIDIDCYIEVKAPPYSRPDTLYYKEIPKSGQQIILSYVSDRQGKIEIQQYLEDLNYKEGINYYMMS